MRKLTIIPKIDQSGFSAIEGLIGHKFSDKFKEFMMTYSGNSVAENIYTSTDGTIWEIAAFDTFTSIYKLTREFLLNGHTNLVPFAFDPGGWHYCLSFSSENKELVYINRWTDVDEGKELIKIADSFTEFIHALNAPKPSA